jgi:hypothetical protein
VLLAQWKNGLMPDREGLYVADGSVYTLIDGRPSPRFESSLDAYWIDADCILAQRTTWDSRYRIKCGESASHGSIGFVALESESDGELLWLLMSEQSNPFDQIEIKGHAVVVLSTSGAILRFSPHLFDFMLLLP